MPKKHKIIAGKKFKSNLMPSEMITDMPKMSIPAGYIFNQKRFDLLERMAKIMERKLKDRGIGLDLRDFDLEMTLKPNSYGPPF